jgi:hypothetical protein
MSSRHIRGNFVFRDTYEKTSAGDVAAADIGNMSAIAINKDSGAATGVTLPAAQYVGQAWKVLDAKGDAGTNNITITPASGTINGAATHVIAENYGAVELFWDGTNYTVSATANPVSAAEAGFLNGVVAGTGAASKALVLGATTTTVPTIVTTSGGFIPKSTQAAAITTTRVLTTADSGGTFSVAKTSAYAITLPTPAQGVRFKFMVLDTGANAVTISDGSAHLKGVVSVNNVNIAMTGTTLSLASAGSVGDWVEFEGIDATTYLVTGACIAAADITIA